MTSEISFRPLTLQDVGDIYHWQRRKDDAYLRNAKVPESIKDVENWIESVCVPDLGRYAIGILNQNKLLIGYITIENFKEFAEIGILLGKNRSHGFGSKSISAFIFEYRNTLPRRIVANVRRSNQIAQSTFLSAGFREILDFEDSEWKRYEFML
jgi:RimJ/RimL family protein N-acetyltransferase